MPGRRGVHRTDPEARQYVEEGLPHFATASSPLAALQYLQQQNGIATANLGNSSGL
jgi:hypothetical protein